MLPSVLLYKKLHTKKGAAISMTIGTLITSAVSIFANAYFTFPAYAINPAIHDLFTLMIFCMLPFNLLKYGIVSLVTFLVYKRVNRVLKNIIE